MSFYSNHNAGTHHCPCSVIGSDVLNGLNEKVCIQVQRVYDSCLWQKHFILIRNCASSSSRTFRIAVHLPPITFSSANLLTNDSPRG